MASYQCKTPVIKQANHLYGGRSFRSDKLKALEHTKMKIIVLVSGTHVLTPVGGTG